MTMNFSFNKAAIVAAVTLAALVLTNAAIGATPGYPKNRPYFGSHWNQSPARSYNYYAAPSYSAPAEESRQSYSYEPTPSTAESKEQPAKQESGATQPQAEQQTTVRRSYSYEPQSQSTTQWRNSGRRFGGGRDRWLFQKADPHRID
jgi:hypothetical protein